MRAYAHYKSATSGLPEGLFTESSMLSRALTSMTAQARSFRLALVQLAVGSDKATNLSRASEKVREATQNGANIVVLPVSIPTNAVSETTF